jgi:hypothetical protein
LKKAEAVEYQETIHQMKKKIAVEEEEAIHLQEMGGSYLVFRIFLIVMMVIKLDLDLTLLYIL